MRTQHELEGKWSELEANVNGNGPTRWQSRSHYEWMLAQKELLEWVLS